MHAINKKIKLMTGEEQHTTIYVIICKQIVAMKRQG